MECVGIVNNNSISNFTVNNNENNRFESLQFGLVMAGGSRYDQGCTMVLLPTGLFLENLIFLFLPYFNLNFSWCPRKCSIIPTWTGSRENGRIKD